MSREKSRVGPEVLPFRQVGVQPLHRGVVRQVAQRILSGVLKPGDPLPVEPRLAKQFGVSRTVVREAAQVLAAKGLISVKQGSGMRVREPEAWDYLDPLVLFEYSRSTGNEGLLEEVLEVRRILEVEAAGLAAQRRTKEELSKMRESLLGMEQEITNPEEFTRLDILFHEQIMQAAHNRPLRKTLQPITEVLKAGRYITNRQACLRTGGAQISQRGHEEIYQAVEKQDIPAARDSMQWHVEQFERDIHTGLLSSSVQEEVEYGGVLG